MNKMTQNEVKNFKAMQELNKGRTGLPVLHYETGEELKGSLVLDCKENGFATYLLKPEGNLLPYYLVSVNLMMEEYADMYLSANEVEMFKRVNTSA